LLTPILLFEAKILDGRNRYRACEMAGVPPQYDDFSGTTEQAVDFVLSSNLCRRHLSKMEKVLAMSAAANIKAKARSRQIGALKQYTKPVDADSASTGNGQQNQYDITDKCTEERGRTSEKIAAKVGMSARKVNQVLRVAEDAPEKLLDAVIQERISVGAAHNALLEIEKDDLARIVDETDPDGLRLQLQDEINRRRRPKKRKRRPPIRVGPTMLNDPAKMAEAHFNSLKHNWQRTTPEFRSEFAIWLMENQEAYPTSAGVEFTVELLKQGTEDSS